MSGENEPGAAGARDEVAELALRFLDNPHSRGLEGVEGEIAQASAEGRWEDVNKWHRVRLRFLRFRQERSLGGPAVAS